MAYIFKRGSMWWAKIKNPLTKKWVAATTDIPHSDANGQEDRNAKKRARTHAERMQREANAVAASGEVTTGPMTVKGYADSWIVKRRDADLDWTNDRGRLTHHVVPIIGEMLIADVRTKQIADLVYRWRFTDKLAPRTVRNIYSTLSAMFRDAAIDGEIEQTPCILTSAQLGPVLDKDPEWRDNAVFTRDEAEQMISDERIPQDRRLYYAFGLLAGMRPGEITSARWRNLDTSIEPLGKLTIAKAYSTPKSREKGTKTDAVRRIPVHPTLAAMLAEWKLSGWAAMFGRAPEPDDLILPLPPADQGARRSRKGKEPYRTGDYAARRWRETDLPMLGWRHREMYATKSTFITLAIEDGAKRDILRERVTHSKPRRDAFSGYDRGPHWLETCREVSKLQIARKVIRAKLVQLA